MKKIKLTQGKVTIVDDEDYEWLSQWEWYYAKNNPKDRYGYARRNSKYNGGKRKTILMHREVLKAEKEEICDHINHNGLDNRKSNLRIVTSRQNAANRRKRIDSSSKYRGVVWYKRDKKWRVAVGCKHIGYFQDIKEAALAYNKKAREVYGDYAYQNKVCFPKEE